MFLIDTSVWVDFLRNKRTVATDHLEMILDEKLPFGITSVIYQEILQGAASEKDFKTLVSFFSTQNFFYPTSDIGSYQGAAKLYFTCRRKGIMIRSSIDCLIAQIAIDNKLTLLHSDKDYIEIKKISPALKLAG